jgi:hypothetical protein
MREVKETALQEKRLPIVNGRKGKKENLKSNRAVLWI